MLTVNLLLVLILCIVVNSVVSEHDPILSDGGTATISLLNYNVSDPDGESIEFTYSLLPNTSAVVTITNIPADAFFVVVQAHSFLRNVTLSYDKIPTPTTSVVGTNVGLWKSVAMSAVTFYLQYAGEADNATIMIAAQAYGNKAPIPGGCNMEFSVETAPYLVTRYTSAIIQVDFAPAAPPLSVMTWLGLQDCACSLKPSAVDHTMYRLHLPERDFSPDMYFAALQKLMTIGRIREWAHAVPTKTGAHALRRVFALYPGTGTAYVAVAYSLTSSAVYVPSFTYGCDARIEDNTCPSLTTVFSNILSATILFLGVFACLCAHRFFKLELLLLGFLAGGLVLYTAVSNLQPEADNLIVSVCGGLAVGIACVLTWCCIASPVFPVLLATSLLGYLMAAILFFVIVDLTDVFVSDINYWISFGCVILLIPALILPLAEKANIISTAILGAYAFVVPIDYYLGSNLRFIFINSIRRAVVPQFKWAVIDPPFQAYDILLSICWICVAVIGVASQLILTKSKPPFPPPFNLRRWYHRVCGPATPTERTPLILPAT